MTLDSERVCTAMPSRLGPGAASAGTLVEFPNLPEHTPANLSGHLARPDSGLSAELGIRDYRGEGPFPAVVVNAADVLFYENHSLLGGTFSN
jgi:hypothetical protein